MVKHRKNGGTNTDVSATKIKRSGMKNGVKNRPEPQKICVFCFKVDNVLPANDEMFQRFMVMSKRYLGGNMKPSRYPEARSEGQSQEEGEIPDIEDNNVNSSCVCRDCHLIMTNFLEQYDQLKNTELRVKHNLSTLLEIMKCADRVKSRVTKFRQVYEGNQQALASVNKFRDGFLRRGRSNVRKSFPRVAVKNVPVDSAPGSSRNSFPFRLRLRAPPFIITSTNFKPRVSRPSSTVRRGQVVEKNLERGQEFVFNLRTNEMNGSRYNSDTSSTGSEANSSGTSKRLRLSPTVSSTSKSEFAGRESPTSSTSGE